jgi:predicted Rossmann-fold nucleotide-binding protein
MPGGFGTLDEAFEVGTLIQTGKLDRFPMVAMGQHFWQPLRELLRGSMMRHDLIRASDLDVIKLTDDVDEAINWIKAGMGMAEGSLKIISGAQSGVGRAALDAAREQGLANGGFVPKGRTAEDGMIPARYENQLETGSEDAAVRTRRNVETSDATLVFVSGARSPGTEATVKFAGEMGKARLVLDLGRITPEAATREIRDWIARERPSVLNVAGPKRSEDAGLHAIVKPVLVEALGGARLEPPVPEHAGTGRFNRSATDGSGGDSSSGA